MKPESSVTSSRPIYQPGALFCAIDMLSSDQDGRSSHKAIALQSTRQHSPAWHGSSYYVYGCDRTFELTGSAKSVAIGVHDGRRPVLPTVLCFGRDVRHGVIKMPSICIRIVKFALKKGVQSG